MLKLELKERVMVALVTRYNRAGTSVRDELPPINVNISSAVFRKSFVITLIISRLELIEANVKGAALLVANLRHNSECKFFRRRWGRHAQQESEEQNSVKQ